VRELHLGTCSEHEMESESEMRLDRN
jgi:hypothetical protein